MNRIGKPFVRGRILAVGFFLSIFAVSVPLFSQSISSVVFLPQTYYVGDRVEARVVLRDVDIDAVDVPEVLPQASWISLESMTTVQRADGTEIRIVFQPFFVGTRELPPIDVGVALLTGITAFVTRVSPGGGDLQIASTRDQLVLPGTQIQVALVIVFLVATPLFVIVAGGWGRRWIMRVRRWYQENRPYRTFQRSMKNLVVERHSVDGRTFYIRLLDSCRDYLAGRFGLGARSATTIELDSVLSAGGIDAENRQRIVGLFRFGDLVKFAGRRVTLDEREQHIEEMRTIVGVLQRQGRGVTPKGTDDVDT